MSLLVMDKGVQAVIDSSNTAYPDIEIYIPSTSNGNIIDWLRTIFTEITPVKSRNDGKIQNFTVRTCTDDLEIPILLIEDARDGYSSVWFQSGTTPWATDLDCALSAAEYFNSEIRCSTGSWSEEPDSDDWFSVLGKKHSIIHWSS
jgi:hypothetical protein